MKVDVTYSYRVYVDSDMFSMYDAVVIRWDSRGGHDVVYAGTKEECETVAEALQQLHQKHNDVELSQSEEEFNRKLDEHEQAIMDYGGYPARKAKHEKQLRDLQRVDRLNRFGEVVDTMPEDSTLFG